MRDLVQGSELANTRYAGRIGERVGSLTFKKILPHRGDGHRFTGLFSCDCGGTLRHPISRILNSRKRLHCGCQTDHGAHRTHGMRKSSEYRSWGAMKTRCHNPNSKDYPRYGARGIRVCQEWQDSFVAFYQEVGPRPPGTTLDRIDGSRGYEPGNVRWATPKRQARNRRDLTVVKTPLGTMPLVDYAKKIGVTRGAAHLRLKRGKLEGVSHV